MKLAIGVTNSRLDESTALGVPDLDTLCDSGSHYAFLSFG
jgi:hypothetical protein